MRLLVAASLSLAALTIDPAAYAKHSKHSKHSKPRKAPHTNVKITAHITARAAHATRVQGRVRADEGAWSTLVDTLVQSTDSSALGASIGGLGVALGGGSPRRERNTLAFRGNALVAPFSRAVTFGHVICYASQEPSQDTVAHEHAHVRQAEVLGPLYLPAHVVAQGAGVVGTFVDRESHESFTGRTHGAWNWLEVGPSDEVRRRPWR